MYHRSPPSSMWGVRACVVWIGRVECIAALASQPLSISTYRSDGPRSRRRCRPGHCGCSSPPPQVRCKRHRWRSRGRPSLAVEGEAPSQAAPRCQPITLSMSQTASDQQAGRRAGGQAVSHPQQAKGAACTRSGQALPEEVVVLSRTTISRCGIGGSRRLSGH
jgi:hypothetical protein